MRRLRYATLFLVLLVLVLGPVLLVADAPETAFDESEPLPYEGTPSISIDRPALATGDPRERVSDSHVEMVDAPLGAANFGLATGGSRHADGHLSSAQLCTLRC